uniref:Uncharacterized protein n=1 Tax=Lutzomyia longipalpis TaxID=7200 RepID=A0A1B0CUL8_LUTLO
MKKHWGRQLQQFTRDHFSMNERNFRLSSNFPTVLDHVPIDESTAVLSQVVQIHQIQHHRVLLLIKNQYHLLHAHQLHLRH